MELVFSQRDVGGFEFLGQRRDALGFGQKATSVKGPGESSRCHFGIIPEECLLAADPPLGSWLVALSKN